MRERALVDRALDAGQLLGSRSLVRGLGQTTGADRVVGQRQVDLHPGQPLQLAVVEVELHTELAQLFDLTRIGSVEQRQPGQAADSELERPAGGQVEGGVLGAVAQQLLGALGLACLEQGGGPPEPGQPPVELDHRSQQLVVALGQQQLGPGVELVAELPQAQRLVGHAGADQRAGAGDRLGCGVEEDQSPGAVCAVAHDVAVA